MRRVPYCTYLIQFSGPVCYILVKWIKKIGISVEKLERLKRRRSSSVVHKLGKCHSLISKFSLINNHGLQNRDILRPNRG